MDKQISLQVKNLTKEYKIGEYGKGTLADDLKSWWARVRKKQDPTLTIGQDQNDMGKRFLALNNVSFEAFHGDKIGIIGENGAGKSTLLKLICRITTPTGGEFGYDGRVASMLEVGTGFNAEMTGRENIYLSGTILGMTKTEIDEKLDEIIEFSECSKFIDTPVKRYSSGMFVKLAFSVAAHLDSNLIIMDEVLAVGDAKFQQKCIAKMNEIANQGGKTILFVSHNMQFIRQFCNRCIVLKKGEVIYDGDVDTGIKHYMVTGNIGGNYFDFSDIRRHVKTEGGIIHIMDFFERKSMNFFAGEKIKLKLVWEPLETDLDFRFTVDVRYIDGASTGTAFTKRLEYKQVNVKNNLELEIDTKGIAPGAYYIYPRLLRKDENGAPVFCDVPDTSIYFNIEENNDDLKWLHTTFGHVKLEDIQVIKN